MKKMFIAVASIVFALFLISWGFTGHRTIGQIAYSHLTPQAKQAVQELLGDESLADAATWADQVRNDPEYSGTASWHFINVPLGLSFDQFQQQVANSDKMNVYTALLKEEKQLTDPASTHDQKVAALKFIAHFVGDIHQPMHVSRAEDKGGNTIQVQYDGQGTNLHALWDTKLLEHAGLSYQQLAEKYDPTAAEINKWQNNPPILWAWESYQVSTQLYAEIDAMKGRTIDNSYYESHIPIIESRIEKAGIRLAGVLNELFKNGLGTSASAGISKALENNATKGIVVGNININDAAKYTGQSVSVTAQVYGTKDFGSMVLVNLGAAYPNSPLTVVLRGDAKALSTQIDGKTITVIGQVIDYKGKPEIMVTDSAHLVIK